MLRTDFEIPETEIGESFDQPFTVTDRDGSSIDLSDKTVTLTARPLTRSITTVTLRNTVAGGSDDELSSPVLGQLMSHFLEAHTSSPGKHRIKITIKGINGYSRTFLGTWEVVD